MLCDDKGNINRPIHNEQTSKIDRINALENFRLNNVKEDFQSVISGKLARKLQ